MKDQYKRDQATQTNSLTNPPMYNAPKELCYMDPLHYASNIFKFIRHMDRKVSMGIICQSCNPWCCVKIGLLQDKVPTVTTGRYRESNNGFLYRIHRFWIYIYIYTDSREQRGSTDKGALLPDLTVRDSPIIFIG